MVNKTFVDESIIHTATEIKDRLVKIINDLSPIIPGCHDYLPYMYFGIENTEIAHKFAHLYKRCEEVEKLRNEIGHEQFRMVLLADLSEGIVLEDNGLIIKTPSSENDNFYGHYLVMKNDGLYRFDPVQLHFKWWNDLNKEWINPAEGILFPNWETRKEEPKDYIDYGNLVLEKVDEFLEIKRRGLLRLERIVLPAIPKSKFYDLTVH